MRDLFFLSFRDVTRKRAGPVLPAQVFRAKNVDESYDWTTPNFWRRYEQGDIEIVPDAAWSTIFEGRHIRFLIHGFNVNRDRGFMAPGAASQELMSTGRLGLEPPLGIDELVVPVLWPGDWYIPGINYSFEFDDARQAGRYFAEFLTHSQFRINRASFVTHSFGVRVALEAVRQMLLRPDATLGPDFDMAIFMASADDNDVFDRPEYQAAIERLDSIHVLSSYNDKTLRFAFPAGDALEAALWRNQRTFRAALGRTGPKLKVGSAACAKTHWRPIPDNDGVDHNDYMPWPWSQDKDDVEKNGWTKKRKKVLDLIHALATRKQAIEWPPLTKTPNCPKA